MKKLIALAWVVVFFSCVETTKIEYDLVIANVNLIDGTGADLKPNVNVISRITRSIK